MTIAAMAFGGKQMNLTAEIFKGMNTPDGKPSAETLERWSDMMEGIMSEKTCGKPNFEDMYNKLCEEHAKLEQENKYLNANLKESMEQCQIMRAQLDMVHLIFGRNH